MTDLVKTESPETPSLKTAFRIDRMLSNSFAIFELLNELSLNAQPSMGHFGGGDPKYTVDLVDYRTSQIVKSISNGNREALLEEMYQFLMQLDDEKRKAA